MAKSLYSLEPFDQTSFAALKPSRQIKGTATSEGEHPEKGERRVVESLAKEGCVLLCMSHLC